MSIGLVVNILLAALMAFVVAHAAASGRSKNWEIIKQYRPRHFLSNIPVLALVVTVAVLLITYVPLMDKNPILWLVSVVFGAGDGTGTGNVLLAGTQWKWYAIIFLPLLAFALPSLARTEEKDFRQGTRNWRHGVVRSIKFGLVHLIMLIPLGAALALSIGGLWFTHQYFKGGVERSTVYHAAYNTIIVVLLFLVIFLA